MKKIILITTLFALLSSSEIKDNAIKSIINYYNKEVTITNKKFSIPKKIKKEIQNKIKQKFYRDQIYYWVVEVDKKYHYALLDNTIGSYLFNSYLSKFVISSFCSGTIIQILSLKKNPILWSSNKYFKFLK